jgi:hypothetical protein
MGTKTLTVLRGNSRLEGDDAWPNDCDGAIVSQHRFYRRAQQTRIGAAAGKRPLCVGAFANFLAASAYCASVGVRRL